MTTVFLPMIISLRSYEMATESFSRTFEVNIDWGVKNLEKAIDEGSDLWRWCQTPEAKAKFKEMTTITEEDCEKLRKAYGVDK